MLSLEDSTICTDGWKTYDGFIRKGYERHHVSQGGFVENATTRTVSLAARATSTE